jgi:23S rRNA (uracil1939-C5)-methyltransferase
MIPAQVVPLTIEKPAAGGRMIARLDGQIVLVSGTIPGERVRARIERVSKSVAYAETIDVDEPSPDRRTVDADPLCGGCLYSHIAYPRQLGLKRAVIVDAFTRIGRLELPDALAVAGSAEAGYRMRARLHLRGGRVGFFREGTHDLCDARQTRQLLPGSCDALDRLAAAIRSLGAESVREIELAENVDASDRVVALDAVMPIDPRSVDRLAATDGLTGVISPAYAHGSSHVVDRLTLGGHQVALQRHVLAFFQGNRHLLGDLVSHVIAQVPADGDVVDLYAGVGLFSVGVAVARGVRVTAIEGDRIAAADLEANAAGSGAAVAAVHGAVEQFVQQTHDRPSTVIVDPPRTGMSRDALSGALGPRRIVYVSCDVATLARDARRLVDAGFSVGRADAFDLFPNTPHVETVVVFERDGL